MNKKYRIAASKGRKEVKLEPGDLVWLHLRKERFPELRKSKLMSCATGPFKILAKINDNAYKLELPPEFRVSPNFNILDLRPYLGEEDEMSSRTMSMQEGEDDEDINTVFGSKCRFWVSPSFNISSIPFLGQNVIFGLVPALTSPPIDLPVPLGRSGLILLSLLA
jgi:hypothetical protein